MEHPQSKWLALTLVALGCGGSQAAAPAANTANEVREKAATTATGPTQPVTKHGSGSVTAHLGPGGGTLELEEGPRVVVPAGAVTGGQDFVLSLAAKTTAFHNHESEKALGPTFAFAPAVSAPDGSSIEVSFPLAAMPQGWGQPSIAYEKQEGEAISYGEDSTRTRWEYDNAKYTGDRVVAKLHSLDGFRLQFVLTNLEAE